MRMLAVVAVLAAAVPVLAQPCDSTCDVVLHGAARKVVNAGSPGQTICLDADGGTITDLSISNLVGTAAQPITVRSCDGTLTVTGGTGSTAVPIDTVTHLRLTNLNVRGSWPDAGSTYSVAVWVSGCSEDLELDHLDVSGTSYTAIRDPLDDHAACRVRRGYRIHHNFIHDLGGEGMFIGINSEAPANTLEDVEISHNQIERSGMQGIKTGNVVAGLSIHDNLILFAGHQHIASEDTGIPLGPREHGEVFNNVVFRPTSWCVHNNSLGVRVFNNLLIGCGDRGVVYGGIFTEPRTIFVAHNTFVGPMEEGVTNWSQGPLTGVITNNLAVGFSAGKKLTGVTNSAEWHVGPGLTLADLDGGFESVLDAVNGTTATLAAFRLTAGSPARHLGEALPTVTLDAEGNLRDTAMPDLGAHEFGTAPPADAGRPAPADAGTPPTDGGVSSDAGTETPDAGTTPMTDAGTPTMTADAGPSAGGDSLVGGCGGCSASGAGGLLGALALLMRRRKN